MVHGVRAEHGTKGGDEDCDQVDAAERMQLRRRGRLMNGRWRRSSAIGERQLNAWNSGDSASSEKAIARTYRRRRWRRPADTVEAGGRGPITTPTNTTPR